MILNSDLILLNPVCFILTATQDDWLWSFPVLVTGFFIFSVHLVIFSAVNWYQPTVTFQGAEFPWLSALCMNKWSLHTSPVDLFQPNLNVSLSRSLGFLLVLHTNHRNITLRAQYTLQVSFICFYFPIIKFKDGIIQYFLFGLTSAHIQSYIFEFADIPVSFVVHWAPSATKLSLLHMLLF